jgi:hypothetical protein
VKKVIKALTAIIIISMVAMAIAPVFAARTPKDDQVFVKVVDSTGKPVAKADVYIYQPTTGAQSYHVATKGNGLAVISLNGDTQYPGWQSAQQCIVVVNNEYNQNFYFYGTFSANLVVNIP